MRYIFIAFGILHGLTILQAGIFAEEFGEKAPSKSELIGRMQTTSSSNYKVTLYRSLRQVNDGEPLRYYLKICSVDKCNWLSTPRDLFVDFKPKKFIDPNHLIVTGSTNIWSASYVVSLSDRQVTALGAGAATVIKQGKHKGKILLTGAKGYVTDDRGEPLGAYWSDRVADTQGNLIEILNSGNSCYPLRYLIDKSQKYPKLQQSINTKVCVEQ